MANAEIPLHPFPAPQSTPTFGSKMMHDDKEKDIKSEGETGTSNAGESDRDSISDAGAIGDGVSSEAGEQAAGGLPSVGSALHAAGKCSRCCFYLKNRCRNGVNCQFCHLPHERRSRGRGCRGHGTSRLLEAQVQVSQEPSAPLTMMTAPPGLGPPGIHTAPIDAPRTPKGLFLPPQFQPFASSIAPATLSRTLPASPPNLPHVQAVTKPPMHLPGGGAPLLLPPMGPPRGLPKDNDLAPPPPENSPGGLKDGKTLLPSRPATAAAAAAAAATRLLGKLSISTPPGSLGGKGTELLATAPPTPSSMAASPEPSVDKLPSRNMARKPPPGLHLSPATTALVSDGFRTPMTTTSQMLSTTPAPEGTMLPRLLGHLRAPPGLLRGSVAAKAGIVADSVTVTASKLGLAAQETLKPSKPVQTDELMMAAPITALRGQLDEEAARAGRSNKPLKVFMSDYECEVPALNPFVPAKKRVPEWTL